MAKQKRRGLLQKTLLPLMLLAIVIFGTISMATAALARDMQTDLTTDKLLSDSYDHALLFAQKADIAYQQAKAMAGCLSACRQLPAEEQRGAVENIIRGSLNSSPLYVSGFAYFEEGELALPANPDPPQEAVKPEKPPENGEASDTEEAQEPPKPEKNPAPEASASLAYSSILRRIGARCSSFSMTAAADNGKPPLNTAGASEEMSESVNRVSSVVQTHSVTAGKNASACQKRPSQALKKTVSRFQFREDPSIHHFTTV